MQVEQVAETSFFKKTFLIGKNSIHYWTVLQQRVFSGLQCAFGKLSTHQGPNGREKPQSKRGIWARRWIHMRLLEARWADGAVDILLWELRKLTTILTGLEVLIPTAQRRAIDLLLGIDLLLLKEAVWKLLVCEVRNKKQRLVSVNGFVIMNLEIIAKALSPSILWSQTYFLFHSLKDGALYFLGLQNHCRWWPQPWN